MSGSLEKMWWEVRVHGVCSAQMIIPYVFFRLEKAICPANCKLTFKDGSHSNSSLNDKTIEIIIKILITLICGVVVKCKANITSHHFLSLVRQ